MHQFYSFDFFKTITDQLHDRLAEIRSTPLTNESLATLREYETANGSHQGVYALVYRNEVVYVGKANQLSDRLGEHLWKLSGRRNIAFPDLHYKAILLDKSMSTAANETLLIDSFKERGACEWNGSGFGAKDPGKERDTTRPNRFDREYPINDELPVPDVAETETVSSLLVKMKTTLPYVVMRWQALSTIEGETAVDLRGVPTTAKALLAAAGAVLGEGWQAVVLSNGMILYKNQTAYTHGTRVYP